MTFIILIPIIYYWITFGSGYKFYYNSEKNISGALSAGVFFVVLLWWTKLIGFAQILVPHASKHRKKIWLTLLIVELYFESIPQLIIQIINNNETGWNNWIGILSSLLSAVVLVKNSFFISYVLVT